MSARWKLVAVAVVGMGLAAGTWLLVAGERAGAPGPTSPAAEPRRDTAGAAGASGPEAGTEGRAEGTGDEGPPASASAPRVAEGTAVRYRVVVRPAAGSPVTWHVVQGPRVASMIPPRTPARPENAWAVTGSAVGGWPHVVDREERVLYPVWDTAVAYRPGVALERSMSRVSYGDLSYDFRRGEASRDTVIAGRPARHYVLETRFLAVAQARGALRGLSPDTAAARVRSDLWFAGDLPFSWAPLAAWGVQGVAAGQEPLDNYLRLRLAPRLRELGLPVRAVTRIRYEIPEDPDFSFPPESRTEMIVEGLQPASLPAAVPEYLEYARRSSSQPSSDASSPSLRNER